MQAKSKAKPEFSSGEVAHLLQSAQTADTDDVVPMVWGQTLSVDNFPVLSGDINKKVCKVTFVVKDSGNDVEYNKHAENLVNYNGTVTLPATEPTAADGYIFYKWSTSNTDFSNESNDFTSDTAVTVTNQPTNTNYTVKLADNQKITVMAATAVIDVTAKTGLKYKGSAYTASELVDVTVKLNDNPIELALTYSADSTEAKNAGDYDVTVGLADTVKNYTAISQTETVTIEKADYTAPSTVEGNIPFGTAIENYEFEGSVTDINNATIQGKFKITSDDRGTAAVHHLHLQIQHFRQIRQQCLQQCLQMLRNQ
ncbi:MAG: hypothetical protein ACI4A5_06390 [Hominilimicola sp.]